MANGDPPGYSFSLTITMRPSARTISTSTRLSTLNPRMRLKNPKPPRIMIDEPTGCAELIYDRGQFIDINAGIKNLQGDVIGDALISFAGVPCTELVLGRVRVDLLLAHPCAERDEGVGMEGFLLGWASLIGEKRGRGWAP